MCDTRCEHLVKWGGSIFLGQAKPSPVKRKRRRREVGRGRGRGVENHDTCEHLMVTVGFSGLLDVDLLLGRFQSISAIFADHGVEMTL